LEQKENYKLLSDIARVCEWKEKETKIKSKKKVRANEKVLSEGKYQLEEKEIL
jgi:hypothetical protein